VHRCSLCSRMCSGRERGPYRVGLSFPRVLARCGLCGFCMTPRVTVSRHDDATYYPWKEIADADKCGEGKGLGFNVNIPWNCGPGVGDSEYLAAFLSVVIPIVYQFGPELILISGGFDAASGDPLGNHRLIRVIIICARISCRPL